MKRRTTLLVLCLLWVTAGFGRPVTENEVRLVVRAFTASVFPEGIGYRIGEIIPVAYEQSNNLYIVNLVPEGWILLSAEDRTLPVLGYSPAGRFDSNYRTEYPVKYWMDYYIRSVDLAGKDKSLKRNKMWDGDLSGYQLKSAQVAAVDPIIAVEWDQDNAWNRFCPTDEEGPGGHAYVGCVGVSMAQAMSVYKYPQQGTGSKTYFHDDYGTIVLHYDRETPYKWDSMAFTTADKYNSKLLYHTAVSVSMDFGADGSSAQTRNVTTALSKYFRYYSGIKYTNRPQDDQVWIDLLNSELVAGRPLIYSGHPSDGTPGHAFNIDGVDSRGYFHLNWGWSGSYNGWYLINNLRPGSNDFTNDQGVITNIRPPVYCPTDLSLSKTTVKEGLPAGAYVGKLKITDEAGDNKYTLTVMGDSVGEDQYLDPDFHLSHDSLKTNTTFTWADKNEYTLYIKVTDTLNNSYQEKFTISIIKLTPTDVNSYDKLELILYPNPSDGRFFILDPGEGSQILEIIDLLGNIVYSEVTPPLSGSLELNYPFPGIYTVRLTNSDGSSVFRKIIIR